MLSLVGVIAALAAGIVTPAEVAAQPVPPITAPGAQRLPADTPPEPSGVTTRVPAAQPRPRTPQSAWTAQNGSGSGVLAFSVTGTPQYLPPRGIQTSPSTHETILAGGAFPRVYHCGSDLAGSQDYLVYSNDDVFRVAKADDLADAALEVDMFGWGDAYPVSGSIYYSLTNEDPDVAYAPRAARLHRGLLMVACSVADKTEGTASPASRTLAVTIDKTAGTITAANGTFQSDSWNNGGDGVYVRIAGSASNDGLVKLLSIDSETQLTVLATDLGSDETGTPNVTLTLEAWRAQNRSAMLSREIGGTAWSIGAEDAYPTHTYSLLGKPWMMGMPITVTHAGTTYMFVGSTNYQNKDGANAGQRAYIDRWTLSAGSWSYDGRVLLHEITDAQRSAFEIHFHTTHLYWDGANLRAKVAVGDGFDDNGIVEFSIAGVDIFGAPLASGLASNLYSPSGGWANHGFIHGGNTPVNSGEDTFPGGMQPTWLITTSDGRTHWGADDGIPAVCSFDESGRAAGDPLTDNTPEYLAHVTNAGVGLNGYVSLVADCDNPDNGSIVAAVVGPSADYGDAAAASDPEAIKARKSAATRVAYCAGGRWQTLSQIAMQSSNGIAVDSVGRVYVATDAEDIVRITPGTLAVRTPLVSSPGGTNAVADANYIDTTIASRLTLSNPTPGVGGAPGLPSGVDAVAVMSRADTATTLASNGSGQLRLTEPGTAQYIKDGAGEAALTRLQANVQFYCEGSVSHYLTWAWKNSSTGSGQAIDAFDPEITDIPTGAYLGNNWSGFLERTTTQPTTQKFTANGWLEMSAVSDRRATLDADAEFMADWHTATSSGQCAAYSGLYTVVGAVFIDPTQRVLLDADYGQTVPDTSIAWSGLPISPFPLTIVGVTHPRGSASREVSIVQKEMLFRLHGSVGRYIQVNFDPISNRLELAYDVGAGEVITSLGDCEWTRATEVIVTIDRSGAELLVSGSVYGNPYGTPVTVAGGGLVSWSGSELRQYDGVFQGDLQMTDIRIATLCSADLTTQGSGAGDPGFGVPDGAVTAADLLYFVNLWVAGSPVADLTTQGAGSGDPGFGVPDGLISGSDLNDYVNRWITGCPP